MRVTAAHEFFHVVQFAYDSFEDGWFMEATATWMEEQVYDTVNDNRQYLAASSLRLPMRSLDYPLPAATPYGNWVFFQFLSEKLGREPIHSMWYRASKSGVYSTLAIRRALEAEGTTLPYRFLGFSSSGMFPGRSFSEGSAFPKAIPSDVWTFGTGKRGTGSQSVRLNHLTGRNYAFWPGSSLTGSWRLKVTVNGPVGHLRRDGDRRAQGRHAGPQAGLVELLRQRHGVRRVLAGQRQAGHAHAGQQLEPVRVRQRAVLLQRQRTRPEQAVHLVGDRRPLTVPVGAMTPDPSVSS